MKKSLSYLFCVLAFVMPIANGLLAQKKIAEFTVVYNYTMSMAGKENSVVSATHTVYMNGGLTRSEFNSPLVSLSAIHDATTGTGAILRELSGQKLLIPMKADDWRDRNKRYEGIRYTNTNESKIIAGYKCIKAFATTNDSLKITVYYTKELIPDTKDYDAEFKNLDGLPLEYEIQKGNVTIRYVLNSINMNPVPASKFDIPKTGYRVMTYEESKKLNPGGS
ncbi:MAG: hypothetical protein ACHQEM_07290 [Chitinophagales bacterium]